MTSSSILCELRDAIVVVTLNRPEKLNALSHGMLLALGETFTMIGNDVSLRAVILTGSGDKAFCAGTDISEIAPLDADGGREVARRGQAVCDQIDRFPLPVIAAVNGVAAGAGCELALACHIRLGSTNAELSLPETKLGIIPGYGGTQRLAREIGRGRALEMMLTGRRVTAAEAARIGLINKVAETGNVLAEAESLAKEIGQLAPLAIRACLRAVTCGLDLPLAEGLALEADLFTSLFASEDMREGTRAFLEKRKPVFNGT